MAGFLAMLGKYTNGSILTIDNLPPYFLPFIIKPEVYEDDWIAEFDHASTPGSRYQYPVFKGCSPRTVKFKLRFDSRFGSFTDKCEVPFTPAPTLGDNITYSLDIASIIAVLEKLKLPKQGLASIIANVSGAFTKVNTGVSDPAPPLCLLALNPLKYLLGYFSEVKITPERYTEYMFPSRISVDCLFLVTPDLIFGTMEDVLREVAALYSYYGLTKYNPMSATVGGKR